jgi:hypothetical protein
MNQTTTTTTTTTNLRGSIYPNVVSSALVAASSLHLRRWDRALRNVEAEQRKILSGLVKHSRRTAFGRRYGFEGIRDYESFAERVPVGDYDSFSPFIDRMKTGEGNVLVSERVRYFGNSSGSSDARRSKWLPITESQIAHTRRAGADTLMRYLAWSRDREFLRGFTLGLFHPVDLIEKGPIVLTTNPVLMMAKMPVFTRPVYLPDGERNAIADYDAKLTAIAEKYLDWDVRAVTGTTCWFPLLFERVLEVARHRGRTARTLADVWPNLRVLLGGGVSAAPYLPFIHELFGREVTLVDSYNATEGGIYATSDHSGERGMLMLPHRGTFFEFIPLDAIDLPSPPRVPLWAVQRDQPYAIVVTTSAGLFAYKLGDIVRFPSTDPLRIEFMGRLSGCLSITQELATHADIEQAVSHAIKVCPCTTVDFAAAADVGIDGTSKSRYLLFVEFGLGTEPDLEKFAVAFDDGMKQANRVYGEHRGVALSLPKIMRLVPGGARRFMQDVTRENLQGKFPRILDDARKSKALAYVSES